jgi:hypothetical protein
VPILLLYVSLTANFTTTTTSFGSDHRTLLIVVTRVFATLFYFTQFLAAWYLKVAFFPAPSSKPIAILQYLGMFLGGLFCSLCGAVACEAFGYDLFLRVMRRGV